MNRLKLFIILVFSVLLSACATGSRAEKRSSGFGESEHSFSCEGPITSIVVYGPVEIYYTQSKAGSRPTVTVDAGSDWEGLRLKQEGSVFTVFRNIKNRSVHAYDVKIRISTPNLRNVNVNTAGKFFINRNFIADSELKLSTGVGAEIGIQKMQINDDLTCEASSSGSIDIKNLAGETVALAASSGADIRLNGECLNISIVGGSGADINVDAKVENASISCSSAANVTMKGEVSGKAIASASSGAKVDIGDLKTGSLQAECSSAATLIVWDLNSDVSSIRTSSSGTVTSAKSSSRRKNNYTIEETVEEKYEKPVERSHPIKP